MNHLKVAGSILGVGLLIVISILFIKPVLIDKTQTNTSDAADITTEITIAIDDWIGYVPICSNYNISRMRSQGIGLRCIDDGANYKQRMEWLDKGTVDMAVVEIGSYIVEGAAERYPGVIVAILDVSNGGDAIVANKDVYPTIDELRADSSAKYSLLTQSPAEFFALTTGLHFGIDYMLDNDNWKDPQPSGDSSLQRLMSGRTDVAVLWEPNVTKATSSGNFVKLVSTAEAQNIIVDALMASRRMVVDQPGLINKVLATYFKSLKYFRDNPDKLAEEVATKNPTLSKSDISNMIAGIHWVNLSENCAKWFGCDDSDWQAEVNVIDTIEMALRTWTKYGVFDALDNPLPNNDPYRLISSVYLKNLFDKGIDNISSSVQLGNPLEGEFTALSQAEWDNLKPFGQLKTKPILFQTGTNAFKFESRQTLDDIVSDLKHYPNFRIKVGGHTGSRGNPQLNQELSQARADAVKAYLIRTYNIDPDRILATGHAGTRPLPIPPGGSKFSTAYQIKLARVELRLYSQQY
jgi:hypothetical protein